MGDPKHRVLSPRRSPVRPSRPSLPGHAPDVLNFAWRDYGPRVGIWRTIQTLDRHNIRATVSLNGEACLAYPEIIEAGKARGWEFMAHGVTNSQSLAGLDEATERDVIARAMALITEAVGERPRGWLGPKLAENYPTRRTCWPRPASTMSVNGATTTSRTRCTSGAAPCCPSPTPWRPMI